MNRRSKAMQEGIQTGDMPEAIPRLAAKKQGFSWCSPPAAARLWPGGARL